MTRVRRLPDDPEVAAAQWVALEARGTLRPSEQRELDAWLAEDPRRPEVLQRARRAYRCTGEMASHPDVLAMRTAALGALPPRKHGRVVAVAAAAAAVLIGAFAALGALPELESTASDPIIADASAGEGDSDAPDRYITRIGERLSATLQDGSVILLNTDSEVRINYSSVARSVELVRGEALFEVAERPDWPFEVVADDQIVRALGTIFNVRHLESGVEVVLVEGRVTVRKVQEAGKPSSPSERAHVAQLEAGERLRASSRTVQVAAVDALAATSWRQGRLSFDETPLRDVVAEINRYRTLPLRIDDPRVAALILSGGFRTADAMVFEHALAAALNVEPRTMSDGVVLMWRGSNGAEAAQ